MDADNAPTLPAHHRARLAAIEERGLSHPGIRLFAEVLGFPECCRARACRRAKGCIGEDLRCIPDNRDVLLKKVLPVVLAER